MFAGEKIQGDFDWNLVTYPEIDDKIGEIRVSGGPAKPTSALLREAAAPTHPTQVLYLKASGERWLPTCVYNAADRRTAKVQGRGASLSRQLRNY